MFICWLLVSCNEKKMVTNQYNIIPLPNLLEPQKGQFTIDQKCKVFISATDPAIKPEIEKFVSQLKLTSGISLDIKETDKNSSPSGKMIFFSQNKDLGDEAYSLEITPEKITAEASTPAGFFYSIQTIKQLLPEAIYGISLTENTSWNLPCVNIKDNPRFPYRGLHMDVSRHFFPKSVVLKQLEIMSHYKLNRLHWHLTDGAGWRIEIDKYPELTEIAAWRPYKTWKEWWNSDRHYCTKDDPRAYGGYFTKEEIKEVLEYAKERHITVIPEIEMPGHSEEVLAVYPQLSCSGRPYVNSDFCIGNEETFHFIENVLTEVMDIFPSQYIHIGGDEAAKDGWRTCPKCQQRMKTEGLKNVDELQSYMIHRVEQFLHSHGRKLLGWDEILEGGLAPDATVMSWQGENGGISAAKSGHTAIMTPGAYCYFDFYQDDPETQPEAIGGYTPIEKVYSYNPVPDSLTETEKKLILGTQANVWAEYISTKEHLEYMAYPRLLALSEVAWTNPENKSWDQFKQRVNFEIPRLQYQDVHPFTLSKEVLFKQKANTSEKYIEVSLESERYPADIHYTLDGSDPTIQSPLYDTPIIITDSAIISARLFIDKQPQGRTSIKRFDYHHAIGKKISYKFPYSPKYTAGGDSALIDGLMGGKGYGDGRWQGFINNDLDVIIDLEKPTEIHYINANFMQAIGPWVWMPHDVEIFTSDDGQNFSLLKKIENPIPKTQEGVIFQDFGFKGATTARFIRYVAHVNDIKNSFIFTDEIIIQ